RRLRERKRRPDKPLAVMYPQSGRDGLESARRDLALGDPERVALLDPARPVVLVRRRGMATLAPSIDVALIPVWGWGRSLGPGHLEPRSAAEALRIIRPRLAIPIHWGTFHPIGTGIRDRRCLGDRPHRFAEMASETAPDVEVRILPPGGQVVIT
ncbi:MAG TPA: hypothetical protein PKA95_00130, partial [Thermomicrobiales bacterium]|nr:hypothetical protein [Thermomicrobiales bacterium]